MPLPKGLTLLDFTDDGDRAKRTLVRKLDNSAGRSRQQSQLNFRRTARSWSKKDHDRGRPRSAPRRARV